MTDHKPDQATDSQSSSGETAPADDRDQSTQTDTSPYAGGCHACGPERDRPNEPGVVVVRYGMMRALGKFRHKLESVRCGQEVIIKSERGQEVGTIVCPGARDSESLPSKVQGRVLRVANRGDKIDNRHLHGDESREFTFCRERIEAHNLPMKLIAVEHLFGGDRIIFYFVAEKRVDFRALVRDLAREFQTRIEMRQVGVRDEARLLGDHERCGRPLCCRSFLKELSPVSMKMAKLQKATLDPNKISGSCGRLMCCLRFENGTYRELDKELPKRGAFVEVPEGVGKVVSRDLVTQILTLQMSGGARINVPVEAVTRRDVDPKEARGGDSKGGRKKGGRGKRSGGKSSDSDSDGPQKKNSGKSSTRKKGRSGRRRSKGKKNKKKGGGKGGRRG